MNLNYTLLFRVAAIGWSIIMLIGCLTPGPSIPPVLETYYDKTIHVAIFVPFGAAWLLAGGRPTQVLLAGILFGGLIEGLQGVLPIHRDAEWGDWLADTIGTLLGVGLGLGFRRIING